MDLDPETKWTSQSSMVTNEFAQKCRTLCDQKTMNLDNPLAFIMADLMTEFWDMGFSQTEIREAFGEATDGMHRYTAGEEKRT